MFIVFSSVILGYVVSKERKLPNLKKIVTIIKMSKLKTTKDIQVFNDIMAQFCRCFIWNFTFIMAPIMKLL